MVRRQTDHFFGLQILIKDQPNSAITKYVITRHGSFLPYRLIVVLLCSFTYNTLQSWRVDIPTRP